jgi:hypothetical protein
MINSVTTFIKWKQKNKNNNENTKKSFNNLNATTKTARHTDNQQRTNLPVQQQHQRLLKNNRKK